MFVSTSIVYFLPSRVTQADMVDAGMADSSQRRFMMSCLSRGASNLLTYVRTLRHLDYYWEAVPKYWKTWRWSLIQPCQGILWLRLKKGKQCMGSLYVFTVFWIDLGLDRRHMLNSRKLKRTKKANSNMKALFSRQEMHWVKVSDHVRDKRDASARVINQSCNLSLFFHYPLISNREKPDHKMPAITVHTAAQNSTSNASNFILKTKWLIPSSNRPAFDSSGAARRGSKACQRSRCGTYTPINAC